MVLNFNYTSGLMIKNFTENNVHGTLEEEIIIGINGQNPQTKNAFDSQKLIES